LRDLFIPDKVTAFPLRESEAQKILKFYIPLTEADGVRILLLAKINVALNERRHPTQFLIPAVVVGVQPV
jgi:hypothetical protein